MILVIDQDDALGRALFDTGTKLDTFVRKGDLHNLLSHLIDL